MSRKDYEYTRQRVIKEYDYKFDCQREACSVYPCYTQWFCDSLSPEGRALLEIEGVKIARKIMRICEKDGKNSTSWEMVLHKLGEERDVEQDVVLKRAGGKISSFKRILAQVETDNNGLSPQNIGRGVNRLFKNIWRVSTDELTVERNLRAYQAGMKETPGVILGEGARRHVSKIVFEEDGNYPQS